MPKEKKICGITGICLRTCSSLIQCSLSFIVANGEVVFGSNINLLCSLLCSYLLTCNSAWYLMWVVNLAWPSANAKMSSNIQQDFLNHFMGLWSETRNRRRSKFSASKSLTETRFNNQKKNNQLLNIYIVFL